MGQREGNPLLYGSHVNRVKPFQSLYTSPVFCVLCTKKLYLYIILYISRRIHAYCIILFFRLLLYIVRQLLQYSGTKEKKIVKDKKIKRKSYFLYAHKTNKGHKNNNIRKIRETTLFRIYLLHGIKFWMIYLSVWVDP